MTCKKSQKWHSFALAKIVVVFARSGETKMRRQFIAQCLIDGIAVVLFGVAILALYQTQPPVASPIPSPPTPFERLFNGPAESKKGELIPPRAVSTIRIFDPLEQVP